MWPTTSKAKRTRHGYPDYHAASTYPVRLEEADGAFDEGETSASVYGWRSVSDPSLVCACAETLSPINKLSETTNMRDHDSGLTTRMVVGNTVQCPVTSDLEAFMKSTNRTLTHRGSHKRVRSVRLHQHWPRRMTIVCSIVAVAILLIILTAGCASRTREPNPEPVAGHTATPHVGWVIMSGDRENPDKDFVCQSNPRTECVIAADRADVRVLAHVHIYYHAAATVTKYTGTIRIGFFDQPHEVSPKNITVRPGGLPGNESVSDFVTNQPGKYLMTIAVIATSIPDEHIQNIAEQVDVTVR